METQEFEEFTCECGYRELDYGDFDFDVWGNVFRHATCNKCGKEFAILYTETAVASMDDVQA